MGPRAAASAPAAGLRGFLLGLADPVLVLGAGAQVVFANEAARRVLGDLPALPAALGAVFDGAAAARVQALRLDAQHAGADGETAPLPLALDDGRRLKVTLHRHDAVHTLLRLHAGPAAAAGASDPDALDRRLLGLFWDSPYPATVQDERFRLVAVNDAFVRFCGYARERLIGSDPLTLMREPDRAGVLAGRASAAAADDSAAEHCLVDAGGRERWYRVAGRWLRDEDGRRLHVAVLQDCSAERAAREQADRSERDLDHWFDMSPVGMVLYDDAGVLVRTNPAFQALVGGLPELLAEATPALRRLLAWEAGPNPALAAGAAPLAREADLPCAEGGTRRLRALVRGYATPAGHRRYMAAVQDLSAEDERDLARLQVGALMDAAGVGVATFQETSGEARTTRPGGFLPPTPGAVAARRGSTSLQSIGRDLVLPECLPEYERVQQALRSGQRAEARYAIAHPELGPRWLLTRVEPGQLASGKRTTSVITLDVTDRELSRSRNEELLHELATILESSPAGIAHLRDGMLVRCNRRFERMLGLPPGSAAGRGARELFDGLPEAQQLVDQALAAVERDGAYQTEFRLPRDGVERWTAVSARRFRAGGGAGDVIAVLSDISRLKRQQAELQTLARESELMFDLSDVGIAFIRDGRIQRANPALGQLTQRDAAALAGLDITQLFADREQFDPAWASEDDALRRHGRWSGERPLRRADGTLLWVQVSKRLVRAGDAAGGIIASYVNVDDRRRAEASVAQQAQTTRAVLDSVLVGIVTVGRDGIEWMNRSARRMFGGNLPDFIGQPIATVATDDADHPLRRAYLDTLPEGEAATFECRLQARDGRRFWVVGNAVVTHAPVRGRQLTYALLDIERRRNAEQRTAAAEASLRRLTEMAPLAISLYDARTLRLQQINPAAQAVLGRDAGAVLGRTPEEIHDADTAARLRRDMQAALAAGEVTRHEYRLDTPAGAQWWDARWLPLADAGAAPDQLLLVATDVTEQRAAQQARLEAALAQRDLLVREVHHRIKNNLQGVAGLMQQIARTRPEVAGVIAEVVGQVQAIAQVYGLQVGAHGPLRVKRVIEAIAGSVQRTLGRDIATGFDDTAWDDWMLPEAEAIPVALTLNELLTNAIKHAAGDDDIACTLALDGHAVRLTVSNPGTLPAGFDLAAPRSGVSGLGLVRALLPRRHARFTLVQAGARVVASIELQPPVVRCAAPAEASATTEG